MGRRGCFAVLSGVKTSGCRSHHRGPPGLASPLVNLYFISWAKRGEREGFGERDFTIFWSGGVMSSHLGVNRKSDNVLG